MADWNRLTRRAAIGTIASGAAALAAETFGFATVTADRAVSVTTAADPSAYLGLDGLDDADAPLTLTNGTDVEMDVTLDSSTAGVAFDVGETGTYESGPVTVSLASAGTEQVAVRRAGGDGGTVTVAFEASFGSGSIDLRRDVAVPAGGVRISDLQFDPNGNDRNKLNGEYVTFENTGPATVDLTDWTVQDEGAVHTYAFPSVSLDSDDTVTLYTGSGTERTADPDAHVYWGQSQPVWNNDGDTAYLYTPMGELEDSASRAGGGGSGDFVVVPEDSQFDAPGDENENLDEEYVTFRNDGDAPIELKNWRVQDEAGHTYRFGKLTLQSNDSVALHTGSETNGSDTGATSDVYWGRRAAVWNNDGDTVSVYDGNPNGNSSSLVVEYSY